MKFLICISVLFSSLYFSLPVKAQADTVPAAIAEQFYMQYPYASEIKVNTTGTIITVDFIMKKEKFQAIYKKENWEYTVMDFNFDRLSEKVKEGFERSRLNDETVEEVAVIYVPSGFETYRIKTKHPGNGKKYHYFSESGRLLNNPPFQD